MKDFEVERLHNTERVIIYEADVDIGIMPLVGWMNSLKGIITRWSCEGDKGTGSLPHVAFWTEPDNDFELLEELANASHGVSIDPICTEGKIHEYNLVFLSSRDIQNFQSKVTDLSLPRRL